MPAAYESRKNFLKISGYQHRWIRPLPGAASLGSLISPDKFEPYLQGP
jgi:hypothetical protein